METKMELAKLKPIIDGKKKNLKYLRDNKGVAINQKVINLVLANTNRSEEVVNELGDYMKQDLVSPKVSNNASKTQIVYNLKFFETDVLFFCIQNINNLIWKNKIAYVTE